MAREPVKAVPQPKCPKGSLFLEFESASPGGRGVWYARTPHDHTIEQVLHPSYFGVSQKDKGLRVGDIIDIEPESAAWRLQARVMAVLEEIGHVILRESENMRQSYEVPAPNGYEFRWEGAVGRWSIYKGEHAVDGGFITQAECLAEVQRLQRDKAA